MKTAMQELIEWLSSEENPIASPLPNENLVLLEKATELLDKEKEQIKKANDDGWSDGRREKFNEEKFFKDSEEYYTKTYNHE